MSNKILSYLERLSIHNIVLFKFIYKKNGSMIDVVSSNTSVFYIPFKNVLINFHKPLGIFEYLQHP